MIDSMYSALPALPWVNDEANAAIKQIQDRYGMHMNRPGGLDGFAGGPATFQIQPSEEEQDQQEGQTQPTLGIGRGSKIPPFHAIVMHLMNSQFRGNSPSVFS